LAAASLLSGRSLEAVFEITRLTVDKPFSINILRARAKTTLREGSRETKKPFEGHSRERETLRRVARHLPQPVHDTL
jgi:hypothetical protein